MKRLVSITFIAVITLLGCITFVNGLQGTSTIRLQYPEIKHNDQTIIVDTIWSWSTPIQDEDVEFGLSQPVKRTFINRVRLLINHLNVYTKQWAAFSMFYVEQYGLIQRLMQRKLVETHLGGVVLQGNGQLASTDNINEFGTEKWLQKRELSYRNDSIENFYSFIKENTNTDFYYIITPYKVESRIQAPYGLFDFKARDEFGDRLKKIEGAVLDMNASLPDDKTEVFYHTDHHWRIEYAFEQMSRIANFLNMSDSIYAPENWTLINSGEEFKGSLSVQVGDRFSDLKDTLYYYVPNFPTKIQADYYEENNIRRRIGTFRQTVLFEEYLSCVKDSRYTNLYMICSLGTSGMQKIRNNEACSDQRILIFADSFGAPIIGYLSVLFKGVDVIDLRVYKRKDVRELICTENYDKIICIYNTATPEMFMFD